MISRADRQQNLKEIHRVSQVVNQITEECFVVPKDAFELKTGNFLKRSRNFNFELEVASKDDSPNEGGAEDFSKEVKKKFCYFKKPSNDSINKYLALKKSEDFREHFEIDYFPTVKKSFCLGNKL